MVQRSGKLFFILLIFFLVSPSPADEKVPTVLSEFILITFVEGEGDVSSEAQPLYEVACDKWKLAEERKWRTRIQYPDKIECGGIKTDRGVWTDDKGVRRSGFQISFIGDVTFTPKTQHRLVLDKSFDTPVAISPVADFNVKDVYERDHNVALANMAFCEKEKARIRGEVDPENILDVRCTARQGVRAIMSDNDEIRSHVPSIEDVWKGDAKLLANSSVMRSVQEKIEKQTTKTKHPVTLGYQRYVELSVFLISTREEIAPMEPITLDSSKFQIAPLGTGYDGEFRSFLLAHQIFLDAVRNAKKQMEEFYGENLLYYARGTSPDCRLEVQSRPGGPGQMVVESAKGEVIYTE